MTSATRDKVTSEGTKILPFSSGEGREIYRHSAAHIMAHALKKLYPDVKLAIGPATSEGFYYDFDYDTNFTQDELIRIEEKMREIIKADNPFIRKELTRQEAMELFRHAGEPYKVELLDEIQDEIVSIYQEGDFVDLCRGPHLPSTGRIKAFKLLSIAGAYWRGDERNKMLQRIYGTAFDSKDELNEYLNYLEEIKKRDHRRLGKELDLFSISDDIGPGLVLWHPRGAIIRKTIEDFWRDEHYKAGYHLLFTPHIARLDLWKKSGHWDFYRENMYSPVDVEGQEYEIKPMNCPFHIHIYKSHLRSYKELPIRFAELGTVYRYERSGVLHGLLRVRGFTQDDAHIFCREEQIEDEIQRVLDFTLFILRTFGFDRYDIYLSTRPEKYVGTLDGWERATSALKQSLEAKGLLHNIKPGEGAFYGPKIDIEIKDSINRAWQCSTIQVDFSIPERFDITYRGSDGKEHRPIMIHRALMGSLERFFGVLIEHYSGSFPLWLSPVQAVVFSIAERHAGYVSSVAMKLRDEGLRVELNVDNEKIGYKVRQAIASRIPYILVAGDKEVEDNTINVRRRDGTNLGALSIQETSSILMDDLKNRR